MWVAAEAIAWLKIAKDIASTRPVLNSFPSQSLILCIQLEATAPHYSSSGRGKQPRGVIIGRNGTHTARRIESATGWAGNGAGLVYNDLPFDTAHLIFSAFSGLI